MNDSDFCTGWRQVRLFSSRTDLLWYPSMLGQLIKPVLVGFPDSASFFSMYQCLPGMDDGDTNIEELPEAFLQQTPDGQIHRSVRLRFRQDTDLESQIEKAMQADPTVWFSDIRDYPIITDLGGGRFCPDQTSMSIRQGRARLVVEALQANCSLVLDALITAGTDFHLEPNPDQNNQIFGTTGQSLLHMLGNVWVHHNGQLKPIGVVQANQSGQPIFFRI